MLEPFVRPISGSVTLGDAKTTHLVEEVVTLRLSFIDDNLEDTEFGIRDNIPFKKISLLGILSLLSKTVLWILFQAYFIRDNIPIIKLGIKRYSKCHLFLGENI